MSVVPPPLSEQERQKMREVCRMIADDAERDAMALDGCAFSGRTMGQNFGQVYASIKSLALMVEKLTALSPSHPTAEKE